MKKTITKRITAPVRYYVILLFVMASSWFQVSAQTEYTALGSILHEWGDQSPVKIRFAYLGALPTGMTNGGIWNGVAVTYVNSPNAGANGQFYLKNVSGEDFNLYYDAALTNPLTNLPVNVVAFFNKL